MQRHTHTHTLTCPARVCPEQLTFTRGSSGLGTTSGGKMQVVGLGVEADSSLLCTAFYTTVSAYQAI